MLVDLVQITTRDGTRLDGAYQAPPRPGAANLAVDAFCFLHGTGGNFYSSTLFDAVAERLLQLGCGVLRANTRGHDLMCNTATTRGGRRLGAAYEIVDDCRHDVAGWLGWLRNITKRSTSGGRKSAISRAAAPMPLLLLILRPSTRKNS